MVSLPQSESPALETDVPAPPSSGTGLPARNLELLSHRDAAYLLAYRICGNWADAEDILQEAYIKAVRAQLPVLTGAPLRKWFLQIAANAALNFRRSDDRRRIHERNAAMLNDEPGLSPGPARRAGSDGGARRRD